MAKNISDFYKNNKTFKERSEENEIIVSELQDTVEYFCGLFEEQGELKGNALKDLKNAVERLEVFNSIGSIYQWGVEVLNKCGIKYKGIKESKISIKEEIDRPTWSKWVVNNIHHIEYFFNGKIVDKKMLNSLFESEGFDTDVDTVEDEIKKAVRSVRLGNLDGNALHIAHNSVGNRIDLVFDVGQLIGDVKSLSNNECVIRINGDIYEQDEMWNFGFSIYLTCDTYPMDFSLAESKKFVRKSIKESINFPKALDILEDGGILYANIGKKQVEIGIDKELGGYYVRGNDWYDNYMSAEKLLMDLKDRGATFKLKESKKKSRKILKESAKPINEKNVAKFVDELNKFCDEKIHYVDADAEKFTKKYGKLYNFKYRFDDTDEIFVVYDSEGTLDMFDDNDGYVIEEINRLAKKNGWYAEPYTSSANLTFGEL